jgi:hypothetical protein
MEYRSVVMPKLKASVRWWIYAASITWVMKVVDGLLKTKWLGAHTAECG